MMNSGRKMRPVSPLSVCIGILLSVFLLLLVPIFSLGEQVMFGSDTAANCSTSEGLSNDSAAEGYILQVLRPGAGRSAQKRSNSDATAKLNISEMKLFNALKQKIASAARGEVATAVFDIPIKSFCDNVSLTAKDLGLKSLTDDYGLTLEAYRAFLDYMNIDITRVWHALLFDCPYDLYWHDKTCGVTWGWYAGGSSGGSIPCVLMNNTLRIPDYDTGYFRMRFYVAKEYSRENKVGTFNINTSLGAAITTAGQTIASIISSNSSNTDLAKLTAYKDKICELVDYNYAAVTNTSTPYGNPWQLVWIFDNDPNTLVVCEGYSKGFQYLCDLTAWSDSVTCSTVTGYMWTSNSNGGGHMWNVVTYNGTRYLVDVTNCDAGAIGHPDNLFMKGFSRTAYGNYEYQIGGTTVHYQYDEMTSDTYKDEDIRLDDDPLGPDESLIERGTCGNGVSWAINKTTGIMMIYGSGSMDSYAGSEPPWKAYKSSITKVVLDKGITGIGSEAFKNCTSLTIVDFRSSVTAIGAGAFSGCPQLTINGNGHIILPTCTASYLRRWARENYINYTMDHDDEVELSAAAPTCTEPGYDHVWYCKACGDYIRYDERPALGHTPTTDAAIAPACEAVGWTEGSHCSVCGQILVAQISIPAKGHQPITDAAMAPTCETAGRTEGSHCSVCGQILVAQTTIPAKGHTPVTDAAVEPTCESPGKTEGSHCSVCGAVLSPQSVRPALEHQWNDGVVTREATQSETGIRLFTCSRCGKTREEVIDIRIPVSNQGWVSNEDNTWSYGTDDKYATVGVKTIDGTLYAFDDQGDMITGWGQANGKWYYASDSGALYHSGWMKDGNTWYYFRPSGEMATGWVNDGGTYYYMKSDGTLSTGWVQIRGLWYYFGSSGAMKTGWINDGRHWYLLSPDGVMYTGWVNSGGIWYYFNGDGTMATGMTATDDGWYFFSDTGVMQTGWIRYENLWYLTNETGRLVTGWQNRGGNWYYLSSSGAMQTGWIVDNGIWYWLDRNGVMVTGEHLIDGKREVFDSYGCWLYTR